MAEKRRFSPRSRAQNERLISRRFDNWGKGMFRSKDAFEVPSGGFSDLINARDHGSEARGRTGSFLIDPSDYAVIQTANFYANTLGYAINDPSGDVYLAKGSAPSTGDIFRVMGGVDSSDGMLSIAKAAAVSFRTPTVNAYDMFRIEGGEELVSYVGNLRWPSYEWMYDYTGNTVVCEKVGNRVTFHGDQQLDANMVGNYLVWGFPADPGAGTVSVYDGQRDFIEAVDGAELVVSSTGDKVRHFRCLIQPPVYARFYDAEEKELIIHTGKRLYKNSIPFTMWKEIPGSFTVRPVEGEGLFHDVDGNQILTNSSGHLFINDNDNGDEYYWKMNAGKPAARPENEVIAVFGYVGSTVVEDDSPVEIVGYPGYSELRPNGLGLSKVSFGGIYI